MSGTATTGTREWFIEEVSRGDDLVDRLEDEEAPDCQDCGTTTQFRCVQGGGNLQVNLQFICPQCDPERVQIRPPPEWLGIEVESEPGDSEQSDLGRWSA